MRQNEIDSYKINSIIHLTGYISTSLDKSIAINFAFDNLQDNFIPVVFEIEFNSDVGIVKLTEEFTSFPGEDEVLI